MNQPFRLRYLALGGFAVLGSGCVSQTLVMARSSSGAVDRDVEFAAQPGADRHFISLPAYPLSNCTDTLVYERLVEDFDAMIRALGNMPIAKVSESLKKEKNADNVAPLHFLTKLANTKVGQLLTMSDLDDAVRKQIAEALVQVIHPGDVSAANPPGTGPEIDAAPDLEAAQTRQQKGSGTLHSLLLKSKSWYGLRSKKVDTDDSAAVKAYVAELIAANATDLNQLLAAGGKDKFAADAMTKVIGGSDGKDAGATFARAAAHFVRYADDYGPSACSSAQRYRDFLGFREDDQPKASDAPAKMPEISWLNRTPCEQLDVLAAIAKVVGFSQQTCKDPKDSDALWPRPIQSFLHFSDVQIREPSAKLGSTQLSHDLKQLVPSFEQDYVQNEYAMFVYDALVKTADAEVARLKDKDRPPPAIMIHTGDSADAGLQSEFDTFTAITYKLHLPWFQAVGNHDVVAFGNLRLVNKEALQFQESPALQESECQGAKWDRIACSCTSIGTLIREKETRHPDNRGEISDALPSGNMPLFPLLLQRVCLLHAVQEDWFVMDPDKFGSGDPTKSFIQSHCKGWRPVPRDPAASWADANGRALNECLVGAASANPSPPSPASPPPPVGQLPSAQPDSSAGPAAPRKESCATLDNQESRFQGFDLLPGFRDRLNQVPATESANAEIGYYCFEVGTIAEGTQRAPVPGQRLWAVILNTNTNEGSYGYLADQQLAWLSNLLTVTATSQIGAHDLVMLFSHHPVWSIYDQRQRMKLTDIVTRSPNVIGYFAGHTHEAGLRVIRPLSGSPGTAKWEIVAPSVIDYPQAVRQVTIKSADRLGYIEVLTFTSQGTGRSVEKIKAAEQGAVRDRCASFPDQCVDGHALLPGREIEFPRLFFKMP